MPYLASVHLGIIAVLSGLQWFLPNYQRPDNLFGVTVAPDTRQQPEGRALIRRWRLAVGATGLIGLAAIAGIAYAIPLPLLAANLAITGVFLAVVATQMIVLVNFHHQARAFALPAPATSAVRAAPLRAASGPLVPLWWEILPLALIVATAGILATHYAAAPALIPIHWDANGHANGFVDKSVGSFYLLVWVQLIIYVLLTALTQMFRLARLGNGAQGNAAWRVAQARLLFLVKTGVITLMGAIAIITTLRADNSQAPSWLIRALHIALLVIVFVGIGVIYARYGQSGWRVTAAAETRAVGDGTPDDHWIGGIIYYNPSDPALFVERRMGMGVTLNFGRPASWLILIAILAVPIGISVFALVTTHHR